MNDLLSLVWSLSNLHFLISALVDHKKDVVLQSLLKIRVNANLGIIGVGVDVPSHGSLRGPSALNNFLHFTLASSPRAIGNSIDNDVGSIQAGALPVSDVGSLALVGSIAGKGIFPAKVIEDGDVVSQEELVWPVGSLVDAGDSSRAGHAALGLEKLEDSERLEVNEASSSVLVVRIIDDGVARVIESDGADEGSLLLAAEDLAEERSHCDELR